MSHIISAIITVSIILYVSGVCSAIQETVFVDSQYHRICYEDGYGTPNAICRQVAQQPGMFSGDLDDISGECKEVGVNLEDFNGNPTRINFEIVFCDFGADNNDACASASADDGVIEYFQYLPNKRGYHRCIHQV